MSWSEVVINVWRCDACEVEVLAADDGLPDGWGQVAEDFLIKDVCGVCLTTRDPSRVFDQVDPAPGPRT